MRAWLALAVLVGCGSHEPEGRRRRDRPAPDPTETPPPAEDPPAEPPPASFVGSPCSTAADCDYPGAICLSEADGFPGGTCSLPCDGACPDAEGYPTTFCAAAADLPPAVAPAEGGLCLARCDFEAFPFTGCRPDHGCVSAARAGHADTSTWVCQPGESALTPCLADLAARGVPFSPVIVPDRSPTDAPELTCHVEDPIELRSGYRGIDLIFHLGTAPGAVIGACAFGHAVADTLEDLEGEGVTAVHHLGAYSCRTIAGTSILSRHGHGDALDISAFDFQSGERLILTEDWEHDTTTFATEGGAWLYHTAYGWHEQQIWSVILTPNRNLAHDSHFHVDLTPGSDFIQATSGFVGPAPYVD